MSEETSTFRLYLMRLLYLLNFVLLGLDVWPGIINHVGAWDPVKGVAFSFWAALSALSGLGLRYPLKMLPLLLWRQMEMSLAQKVGLVSSAKRTTENSPAIYRWELALLKEPSLRSGRSRIAHRFIGGIGSMNECAVREADD